MNEFTVAEALAGERSWGPPGANEKWKRAARRLIESGMIFDRVWMVEADNGLSCSIDSVWSTEGAAEARAAALNNGDLYIRYSVVSEQVRFDPDVDDPVYDDD